MNPKLYGGHFVLIGVYINTAGEKRKGVKEQQENYIIAYSKLL